MHINSASHNVYYGPQADRPTLLPTQQLIERPVQKSAQSEASQTQADRNPDLSSQNSKEASKSKNSKQTELSEDEKKQVEELKTRDREVRAHEAAHKNAAGSLAKGGAEFSYQTGPDGHRYAVGGEVNIDTSKENDPAATIRKAQGIRQAANAPAEPSGQDRAVAAQATKMEAEARQELNEKSPEEQTSDNRFAQFFSDTEETTRPPGKLLNVSA